MCVCFEERGQGIELKFEEVDEVLLALSMKNSVGLGWIQKCISNKASKAICSFNNYRPHLDCGMQHKFQIIQTKKEKE